MIFYNDKTVVTKEKCIVFVCTENTCRSPIAEGIAKKIMTNKGLPYIIISRAIRLNPDDAVANTKAIAIMKMHGIDISQHKSEEITDMDIKRAALILTMADNHKKALLKLFPSAEPYVFTITKYATGKEGNVSDPWGQGIEEYARTASQLNALVPQAIERFSLFLKTSPS